MKFGWKVASPAAAAVAIGGVLVGYTVFGKTEQAEIVVGMPSTVSSPSQIVLPLDAYVLSRQARRVNSTAISVLGRDCMRRLGFEWPVPDRTPPSSEEADNARRYGMIDERHAAAYGYHRDPAEAEYNDRIRAVSQQIPNEALAVWTGDVPKAAGADVPEGGCGMEARRKLGVPPDDFDEKLVEQLSSESLALSERHPRVQEALTAWSACMEEAGFRYRTPWEAAADKWDLSSELSTANDQEIATATADASCNRRANLAGVWLAVESAYQRRLIDEHADELSELKRWRDQVAAASSRVAAAI